MILPEDIEIVGEEESLPMLRDIAVDLSEMALKKANAMPSEVLGKEALMQWIWKAIHTRRAEYAAYSDEFGSEISQLKGKMDGMNIEEAICDALLVSPYIENVELSGVSIGGGAAVLYVGGDSVYGEIDLAVELDEEELDGDI